MQDLGEAVKDEFEGRFLVYELLECDREAEGSTLLAYHIVKGKANRVLGAPSDFEPGMHDYRNTARLDGLVKKIRAAGKTEVVAPVQFSSDRFFGIETYYSSITVEGDEDVEWSELRSLEDDGDVMHELTQRGIAVRRYDVKSRAWYS
jgi:hypothetical protein